jgi:hypothetical protein
MVESKEMKARMRDHFRFSKQELAGLIPAILITAFIFSFRDWGEAEFNLFTGMTNLVIVAIIAAITFFVRIAWQKFYALKEGYHAEFKVWWAGLAISLVLIFLSNGRLPLILIGTVVASLMVRQRLGEFRYGFSHADNATISFFGLAGNLLLAILFGIGAYFVPQSYFFSKGLILNMIMAFTSIIPLPQLDGLSIYFGSRALYWFSIFAVFMFGILLLTKTKWGLILAILSYALVGIVMILKEP